MEKLNLHHISTGKPTYWPSDHKKRPDLFDFCVIKGIPHDSALIRNSFDLTSDHSPVLISLNLSALQQASQPTLCKRKNNWDYFRYHITANITLNVPLGRDTQIEEAFKYFTGITNGPDGLLPRRLPTPHCLVTTQSLLNKLSLRKEDCGKNGTYTGHLQAKKY
jgi:hypothetical protein